MNTRVEGSLVTVVLIINILMLSKVGGTVSLSPSGKICICPEEQLLFTCQVSAHNHSTLPQIDWLIQFEATGLSDVQWSYNILAKDDVGDVVIDDRNEYTFVFNLTYYDTLVLISTLKVTIVLSNVSILHQATINCNQETNEEAAQILHICGAIGFPSSPMNLTYLRSERRDDAVAVIMLSWNSADALANYYTILIYSPTLESSSTFTTSKTSFELSLAYNQEYNISVIASNCAGNSTPTEIMILVTPVIQMDISDISINELSTTGPETKAGYFIALGIMVPGIITAMLITVGVLLKKALKKHQESDYVPNHYSDLPLSREVNSTQHIDYDEQRRSIHKAEAVNQQITYASISQQHSQVTKYGTPNFCHDLSLALDDRVDYVQVNLQSKNNDHINRDDSIDVNLDTLLIRLHSHMTPMWKEFGLVIGIAEEVLDRYSSYPPEECLVEVLDYWLRKYHTAENKLTWRDVAKVVKEIGLHQLAESILNVYQTGQLPVQVDMAESLMQSNIEQPPPLPPKMAKRVQGD